MTIVDAPACPFCQARWTAAMLDEFARFSAPGGCRCCGGEQHDDAPTAPPVPQRDLCCETCGKAIYRKP